MSTLRSLDPAALDSVQKLFPLQDIEATLGQLASAIDLRETKHRSGPCIAPGSTPPMIRTTWRSRLTLARKVCYHVSMALAK